MLTEFRLRGSRVNHNLVSCCCGFMHANKSLFSPKHNKFIYIDYIIMTIKFMK